MSNNPKNNQSSSEDDEEYTDLPIIKNKINSTPIMPTKSFLPPKP